MRLLLLALLFIQSASVIFGQSLPSHDTRKTIRWRLLNPIIKDATKITFKSFEVRKDSIFINQFGHIEEHTYKAGNLQKITFRYPTGDSISGIYYFDKKGRIKRQERVGKNTLWPIIIYTYDEKKRISKEVCYNATSKIDEQTVIYFNKNFQPIKKEEYIGDNVLRNYRVFEYNSKGDLVKELLIYTANGGGITLDASFTGSTTEFTPWPNDTTVYQLSYDSLNRLIEKKKFSNSKLRETLTKSYFQDSTVSNLMKFSTYNGRLEDIMLTTETNSKQVIRKNSIDLDGKTISSWTKLTFENGSLTANESYSFGSTNRYFYSPTKIYSNDHKGNWIKIQTYEKNQLTGILERDIKYR